MKKKIIIVSSALLIVVGVLVVNVALKSNKTVKATVYPEDPYACFGYGICCMSGTAYAHAAIY